MPFTSPQPIKVFIPGVIVLAYNSAIYPRADFDLIVTIYITLTRIDEDERNEVKGEKSPGKLLFGPSSWLGCHMRGGRCFMGRESEYYCICIRKK